jgi:hypothetical protein
MGCIPIHVRLKVGLSISALRNKTTLYKKTEFKTMSSKKKVGGVQTPIPAFFESGGHDVLLGSRVGLVMV